MAELAATTRDVPTTASASGATGTPGAATSPGTATPPSTATARTPPAAGTIIRDCPTCPLFTVLRTGSFQQGSAAGTGASRHEQPRHLVAIAYPIAMQNRDVTVADFREFTAATGREVQGCDVYEGTWRHQVRASWKDPGFKQGDSHPVTCVSFEDAVAYARWLSDTTGHRYRLPSASEWEYAARAGSDAMRPWGADAAEPCANANVADQSAARRFPGWDVFACDDGYANTSPVSTFKANAFGLDDMLGNVFQWTADCWHADYAGAPTDGSPRQDGDCTERELRGGSWFSAPAYVRPAYRNHFAANYRTSSVGFRLVREVAP
jgi:formylglycine-generating enzyme required for sulfatase activity